MQWNYEITEELVGEIYRHQDGFTAELVRVPLWVFLFLLPQTILYPSIETDLSIGIGMLIVIPLGVIIFKTAVRGTAIRNLYNAVSADERTISVQVEEDHIRMSSESNFAAELPLAKCTDIVKMRSGMLLYWDHRTVFLPNETPSAAELPASLNRPIRSPRFYSRRTILLDCFLLFLIAAVFLSSAPVK